MADRALSQEAMLAGLHDIRLPSQAAGSVLADLLAAVALGLFLAVVVALVLRFLLRSRPSTKPISVKDRLTRIGTLPEDDQRLALLHLLKQDHPHVYARISARLYEPGGLPDLHGLEREVSGRD
ncbi:hypothetical protein GI582_17155 [Sulfitobacter sp. BDSS02]|nr:hypothetical protein [Sulfitobacter sp. BDSS02]MBR9849714.1 hypothetical protein [Paracoccaceae bacterium]